MADPTLPRLLASAVVEALKKAGHIVLARGESERLLKELAVLIEPILPRIVPRLDRTVVLGEVTSTFGDEATDEAVEQLVERLRQALLDADGVEDVFADDRTIERAIFRALADAFEAVRERAEAEVDDAPPISVRLETLGYVAAAASRGADEEMLREALDRAAQAAESELDTFDVASRTAFFRTDDPDPERRLDIEEAIEEELSELVDVGILTLPTATRSVPTPAPLEASEPKARRRAIDQLAQKWLSSAICPGSWEWDGPSRIKLTFTPLAEPDDKLIDEMTASFTAELPAVLSDPLPQPREAAPRGRDGTPVANERPRAPSPELKGALGLLEAVRALGTSKKPAESSAPKSSRAGAAPPPSSGRKPSVDKEPEPKAAKRGAATKTAAKPAAKKTVKKATPAKPAAKKVAKKPTRG